MGLLVVQISSLCDRDLLEKEILQGDPFPRSILQLRSRKARMRHHTPDAAIQRASVVQKALEVRLFVRHENRGFHHLEMKKHRG